MKTAVDKVPRGKGGSDGKGGKGRIVNAGFAVMCAHYLPANSGGASTCSLAFPWRARTRIWPNSRLAAKHSGAWWVWVFRATVTDDSDLS